MTAPRAPKERRARMPVARVTSRKLGGLPRAERQRLTRECYELWSEFFEGMSEERFAATHLFDDTWLVTARGHHDRLAGFFNYNVSKIQARDRHVLILTAGFFTRLEYAARRPLIRRGVAHVIATRLRHPSTELAFVPVATTPVAFRAVALEVWQFFPRPHATPPEHVLDALRELARRRGMTTAPENPFVIDFFVRQRRVDGLTRSSAMRDPDDAMQFFVQTVPDWREGKAVQVWIPGAYSNVLGGLLKRVVRRKERARWGRPPILDLLRAVVRSARPRSSGRRPSRG